MSIQRIWGGTEAPAEQLEITLDGLAAPGSRISTQYRYRRNLAGDVFPLCGWLDITLVTAADPTSGQVACWLVPGTEGVPIGGLSPVDASASGFDPDELPLLFSVHNTQLTTSQTRRWRMWIGMDANVLNAFSGNTSTWPTNWRSDLHQTGNLPAFWSLVVQNGTNQPLGTGSFITFTPCFYVGVR